MKYRPEIDGLRALAVVPVILFHAGFESFSGGFVGVDVFFVISGYLITTILINELEENRFSVANFYERRARRILPALFFVMIVCIPFAWMSMLPSQLKDFSQSLAAVSFFASNILFWRESGYFATAAEEKPLLHTWSLAVEEQYYILFPIFLFFTWRYGKNKVFWMIVAFSGVSLALSEWGWRNAPTANFYLAPTRAWELFAGSIAAFIVHSRGLQSNNLLAVLGLMGIITSIFIYDKSTPFPSLYTLVPVFGVVLLVIYADKRTMVARILSARVFVGVGLISYSAYLWHQPLFAFARIRLLENPPWYLMMGLSVVSLFLAALTWRFVEAPFRTKQGLFAGRRRIFSVSGVILSSFIFVGLIGHVNNGFTGRMPAIVNAIDVAGAPVSTGCQEGGVSDCVIGEKNGVIDFALIGDSHAGRYAYALEKKSKVLGFNFRLIQGGWCAPLINWSAYENANNTDCFDNMAASIEEVANDDNIKTVVLSAQWANYTKGYRHGSRVTTYQHDKVPVIGPAENYKAFSRAFNDTVDLLLSSEKRLIIIEPVPEYGFSVPKSLVKVVMFDYDLDNIRMSLDEYYTRNEEFFDVLDKFRDGSFEKVSVNQFFCDNGVCNPYSNKLLPYYSDGNHLSTVGLELLEGEVLNTIFLSNE